MNAAIHQRFEQGLGDAKVCSITWTDEDLILELDVPGKPPQPLRLLFRTVSHVLVDLEYGAYVGQPLLYSAAASQAANGRWMVQFQFGVSPDGKIEFECAEIVEHNEA